MNYLLIIRPLIGAGIGYITNWLAVKMMFRPLHPIKIGKFTLPFTPGIIPRNKDRIAKSIGNAINDELLTENTIVEALLSDEIKNKINENIVNSINSQKNNTHTIEEVASSYTNKDNYDKMKEEIENKLSEVVFENIKNAELGNLIAKQIENAMQDGMQNSMLGLLGGASILSTISNVVSNKIDNYIEENGKDFISKKITEQLERFSSKQISELAQNIEKSQIDITKIIMNVYEKFITQKIPEILKVMNISKIISDKIEAMDILEVEKMIIDIMKKELNALVNLGAVIGFILGLLNLLF